MLIQYRTYELYIWTDKTAHLDISVYDCEQNKHIRLRTLVIENKTEISRRFDLFCKCFPLQRAFVSPSGAVGFVWSSELSNGSAPND